MSQLVDRQQLRRFVHAVAIPGDVALGCEGCSHAVPHDAAMLAAGDCENRRARLLHQLDFLSKPFEDLGELARCYVHQVPPAADLTAASDSQRMLHWLAETQTLSPTQRDYVTCQRSRQTIEALTRREHSKYVHFQRLSRLVPDRLAALGSDESLHLLLNPIRIWTRLFTHALLDDQVGVPADVLFFAWEGEVRTAVLELEGQALINELADYQPCTLSRWCGLSQLGDRQQFVELCQDLARMGLVALA